MNTETRRPSLWASLAILLAGSLLVGFSQGSWQAPLAAWIGPALIIRYARDHRSGRGYLPVLLASILAISIGFSQVWLGGFPMPMPVILAIGIGFLGSLPYLVDRLLSPRLQGFSSTLAFPLAATTLEFVNLHGSPLGMWGATGFTQYGNLPIMQLASVTGMIGITFLMGWFAAIANWVWENRAKTPELRSGLLIFGGVLSAVLIFGYVRLNASPLSRTEGTIRVAGITAVTTSGIGDMREVDPQIFRDAYFEATAREAQAGAQLVTWPEIAGLGPASEEETWVSGAGEIARQYGIYVALPIFSFYPDTGEPGGQPAENKLLLIDPSGVVVLEHVKYGGSIFEGYRVQGDGILRYVQAPFGALSGAICWDLDYPGTVQQAGANGTGLMLAPSSDWLTIDPIHTHMAVFRAIENGMSLVRQTNAGLSMAVDAYGRVLAQTDFFGATDRTMVAQVPVEHVATLYTAFGRWLEWLAPAGLLALVVISRVQRMRSQM